MPFPTRDFPSTAEIARWKEEDDFFRLYNSDLTYTDNKTPRGLFRLKEFFENDEAKAKILDVALNVGAIAVDSGTDFTYGRPVKIEIDDDSGNYDETEKAIKDLRKRTELDRRLKESATLFQAVGHTQFKVYAEMQDGNRVACVEEIPYDNWSPNWSGVPFSSAPKDVRVVSYLTQVDAEGKETKYIYVENYFMDGGKAKCHKSLWLDASGKLGDPADLSLGGIEAAPGAVADPKNPKAMIEDTGLREIPVVEFHMRKTVKERYGQSLLKKGLPIIHQINDRLTQLSIQFLKHLNAKLQIPASSVVRNQDGSIQSVNMEVLLAMAGEPEAKYVTNDNPLIEECFTHIDKLVRKFAKLVKRPDSFFIEDEKGGVESAESLRTRLMYFLKEIENYVSTYDPGVEKLIRLALKIQTDKNADTVPLKLTFDPGLPKDWQADVTVWGDALASKLASRKTAVSRFQDIEGDDLEKELAAIDEDDQAMMESQLALATAQPDPADGEEKPPA